MAAGILAWSTLGGALVGLLLGALAFGALLVIASLLPAPMGRAFERVRFGFAIVLLAGGPLLGAVLGYLEGRLKV
jgi:hypothetical protein